MLASILFVLSMMVFIFYLAGIFFYCTIKLIWWYERKRKEKNKNEE